MKKFVFVLVLLALAAPASADVIISCANEANLVTISYENTEGQNVRAMAIEITLSGDGTIEEPNCLSADFGYRIYPGSISIDSGGNVTDWGNCKCSGSYPGTPDDVNQMTVEMGSLYADGEAEPCDVGDLISFKVAGSAFVTVSLALNEIRGGIVMEDAGPPSASDTSSTCVINLTIPNCWDNVGECGGQDDGDADCDGNVNFVDLGLLKASFFANYGDVNYNCCADFNQDCSCNFLDLGILKANFFTTGWTPATGNTSCEGIPCPP
jgi:hypothetical protein